MGQYGRQIDDARRLIDRGRPMKAPPSPAQRTQWRQRVICPGDAEAGVESPGLFLWPTWVLVGGLSASHLKVR